MLTSLKSLLRKDPIDETTQLLIAHANQEGLHDKYKLVYWVKNKQKSNNNRMTK